MHIPSQLLRAYQLRLIHLKKICIYLPIVEDNEIVCVLQLEKQGNERTFTITQYL